MGAAAGCTRGGSVRKPPLHQLADINTANDITLTKGQADRVRQMIVREEKDRGKKEQRLLGGGGGCKRQGSDGACFPSSSQRFSTSSSLISASSSDRKRTQQQQQQSLSSSSSSSLLSSSSSPSLFQRGFVANRTIDYCNLVGGGDPEGCFEQPQDASPPGMNENEIFEFYEHSSSKDNIQDGNVRTAALERKLAVAEAWNKRLLKENRSLSCKLKKCGETNETLKIRWQRLMPLISKLLSTTTPYEYTAQRSYHDSTACLARPTTTTTNTATTTTSPQQRNRIGDAIAKIIYTVHPILTKSKDASAMIETTSNSSSSSSPSSLPPSSNQMASSINDSNPTSTTPTETVKWKKKRKKNQQCSASSKKDEHSPLDIGDGGDEEHEACSSSSSSSNEYGKEGKGYSINTTEKKEEEKKRDYEIIPSSILRSTGEEEDMLQHPPIRCPTSTTTTTTKKKKKRRKKPAAFLKTSTSLDIPREINRNSKKYSRSSTSFIKEPAAFIQASKSTESIKTKKKTNRSTASMRKGVYQQNKYGTAVVKTPTKKANEAAFKRSSEDFVSSNGEKTSFENSKTYKQLMREKGLYSTISRGSSKLSKYITRRNTKSGVDDARIGSSGELSYSQQRRQQQKKHRVGLKTKQKSSSAACNNVYAGLT
eukprot:jgi/Bigna1/83424/fgenesh1_pg.108_\